MVHRLEVCSDNVYCSFKKTFSYKKYLFPTSGKIQPGQNRESLNGKLGLGVTVKVKCK